MSSDEAIERRLRAVERTLTDGDHDLTELQDASALLERVETVEDEIDEIHDRADSLEAATQAVRGYVGNVRSVNSEVEQRADAAVAAVDRLERRLDDLADSRSTPRTPERAGHPPTNQAEYGSFARSRSVTHPEGEPATRPRSTDPKGYTTPGEATHQQSRQDTQPPTGPSGDRAAWATSPTEPGGTGSGKSEHAVGPGAEHAVGPGAEHAVGPGAEHAGSSGPRQAGSSEPTRTGLPASGPGRPSATGTDLRRDDFDCDSGEGRDEDRPGLIAAIRETLE